MQLSLCAQIAKTYGKEGEILLRVESDRFSELLEEAAQDKEEIFKEPVFIYFDALPVPFFIESVHHRSNNAWVVTFSTIRDLLHAEEIVGRNLYMESGEEDAFSDLDSLTGFTVIAEDGKVAGTICKVLQFPGNICLELKESQSLIPFHEDLILSFNPDENTIAMKIPKGLI